MGGGGERSGQSRQDICFSRRFLTFFLCDLSGAKSRPETQPSAGRQPLPSRTGFNKRYLAGNRAGALGAIALVPGELRAALAPSRLLLLVHANPCQPGPRRARAAAQRWETAQSPAYFLTPTGGLLPSAARLSPCHPPAPRLLPGAPPTCHYLLPCRTLSCAAGTDHLSPRTGLLSSAARLAPRSLDPEVGVTWH